MGDIVKIFADIGEIYQKDEKRLKNEAYKYNAIKAYLCDIETKQIEPNLNISKDDLIICRFGVGANSGNLFPNSQFLSKEVNKDEAKFIKGVLRSVSNLLSFFEPSDIEKDAILSILPSINEGYFADIIDEIKSLDELKKEKGKKVATFFSLSYKGKPVSAYFKQIFENHISIKEQKSSYGYDILTNEKGIGGDANLAFCSVNEMPTNMKNLKIKLLPISAASAHKIRVGFLAVDKYLSHMLFYADKIGYYMAILPTVLAKDKTVFEKVIEKIRRIEKSNIEKIESGEYSINRFLEKVAKEESGMPVLNTILFYSKSNASINMLLQIDDVLPSFIANTSKQMSNFDISAFSPHNNQNVIFVEKLFNNKIEVIKFLLSRNKFDTDIMINKYYRLLYNGKNFINWASCFNGFRIQYGIDTIKRYQMLFNKLNILTKKIIFQKEFSVEEVEKIKDMKKEEIIKFLLNSTDFIKEDDVLNSAYLLGMMSAGLVNWQYALYKGTAFEKWLNNSGAITKESLDRIYAKSSCVYKTLKDVAGNDNKTIQYIDYAGKTTKGHNVKRAKKEFLFNYSICYGRAGF